MIAHHSTIQLIGETVIVSYVTDPSISYGKFRLENHGIAVVTATVESAWLKIGEQLQPLVSITVFDLDREQMVNPQSFNVAAKEIMTFLLGFPKIAYEPRFGEFATVGLRLRTNGIELQAVSPIKFERRIPCSR